MGDKNAGIQKIDQTQVMSRLFSHKSFTMINTTGPGETRPSQLIFAKTEEGDGLEQNMVLDWNKTKMVH